MILIDIEDKKISSELQPRIIEQNIENNKNIMSSSQDSTYIKKLKKNWDGLGKIDPLWAILTCPEKKGNKWQIEEFFEKGVREIQEVMNYVDSLDTEIKNRKALDFGCGVGRLSQALACHFDEVYGIDIAPSMIYLANKYNRYKNKCEYCLNDSDDLLLFKNNTFDFIYTNITLQHIQPKYSKKYLKEFLRILITGGLLIFQLPSQINLKEKIQKVCTEEHFSSIEMYGIPKTDVVNLINESEGKVIDITNDYWAGPEWLSYRYCVVKR